MNVSRRGSHSKVAKFEKVLDKKVSRLSRQNLGIVDKTSAL